mgnify:CR=1 FL=1
MYEKEAIKTIFILTDENEKIYYSNIRNTEVAEKIIKLLNIRNNCNGCFLRKEVYDYVITADKFHIEDKAFWVVIAETKDSYKPYRDLATDLYNRNYWEHLKEGIVKLQNNVFYSLVIIDIDNLKECNDVYGHKTGDMVIAAVGEAIKDSIRDTDIPIHYGGDEYIIILTNTDISSAKKVVKRIRKKIKNKFINEKLEIEISAGTAVSNDINELEQIMQAADEKMYMEKRKKKRLNTYII